MKGIITGLHVGPAFIESLRGINTSRVSDKIYWKSLIINKKERAKWLSAKMFKSSEICDMKVCMKKRCISALYRANLGVIPISKVVSSKNTGQFQHYC